jgi:hypothetical protein
LAGNRPAVATAASLAEALQRLAFVIHSPPEIDHLADEPDDHLTQGPAPMTGPMPFSDSPVPDIGGE